MHGQVALGILRVEEGCVGVDLKVRLRASGDGATRVCQDGGGIGVELFTGELGTVWIKGVVVCVIIRICSLFRL